MDNCLMRFSFCVDGFLGIDDKLPRLGYISCRFLLRRDMPRSQPDKDDALAFLGTFLPGLLAGERPETGDPFHPGSRATE